MSGQLRNLVEFKLYDKHLIKAINTRVVSVAVYIMNVCNTTEKELDDLDKMVKETLRGKRMHGGQSSDERLYLQKQS